MSDPGIDTTLDVMDRSCLDRPVERRRLLQWLAAGPVVLALGGRGRTALAGQLQPGVAASRELSMVSTHTGESLAIRYFEAGQYLPAALQRLNRLLRDHRTGEVKAIDPALFDRLHALALCARCAPHYEIISGYRSPATNLMLRETGSGVASTACTWMAARSTCVWRALRAAGCAIWRSSSSAGGVGYYAKSNFVHLDTGRVRSWTG